MDKDPNSFNNINILEKLLIPIICFILLKRNSLIFNLNYENNNIIVFFNKKIVIKFDFDKEFLTSPYGPGYLLRSLLESLKTYNGKCNYDQWNLNYTEIAKNEDKNLFFYIFWQKEFCKYAPQVGTTKMRNVLIGPIFVPDSYLHFPNNKRCIERNFSNTLNMLGACIIHSFRVRNHLMNLSGTADKQYKYGIMRACTNLSPSPLKSFKDRNIDIILYEKYSDENRKKDGRLLYQLLADKNFTIKRISYHGVVRGTSRYNHHSLKKFSNNAKFIIYFSFWDTGAIALKEIQNFGVYSFTVQKDLVIDNRTGFFVPELDGQIKKAVNIIVEQMKLINNENYNTTKFAEINQNINNCHRSLDDLCNVALKLNQNLY